MGEATIFRVQQQRELSRTGPTDAHCARNTRSQVRARGALPLLEGRRQCLRSDLGGTFSCVRSDANLPTLFPRW